MAVEKDCFSFAFPPNLADICEKPGLCLMHDRVFPLADAPALKGRRILLSIVNISFQNGLPQQLCRYLKEPQTSFSF